MIRLICNNCQTALMIDDGFAGGVCRCQHCGTIQTVPRQLRNPAAVSAGAPAPKTLYQGPVGREGPGLDDLANIVVSSGLSSARLRAPVGKPAKSKVLLLVGGGALIAALAVLVTWLVLRGRSSLDQDTPAVIDGQAVLKGPQFLGVRASGSKIIFLADRGHSTQRVFSSLRKACFQSIASLNKNQEFQILFWDNHSGPLVRYPASGYQQGGAASVEGAEAGTDQVNPFGQTDLAPAVREALLQKPDEIFIATGKIDLNQEDLAATIAALKGASVRVHTFALASDSVADALRSIAQAGGGVFRSVSQVELTSLTK